jgi:hypothetical protein
VASDHHREKAHLAEQHLRGGHRSAGGGGDQALALAEGSGGETEESISSLLRYFKERALPDLGSNIKCGNSLIGYDYYDDHKNLSAEEMQRINAFEWKTEFPEVFEREGLMQ